ncbi:flagellar basal body P-ring formation chaperone FlgA [bacterium]|nr:flagellar basal body P-ring formation chaperone FlgA [bacterium]MBU1753350.1 flagellar basal body P-ring formation chaperone FlgA [bacterium]
MKLLGFVIGAIFFAMVIFWVSMGYCSGGISRGDAENAEMLYASMGHCSGLTLKTDTVVDGDNIFLKDIVSLSSWLLPKDMGDILIGNSPLPGKSRSIGVDYIKLKLKQSKKEDVSIIGEKIVVVRSSQRLDVNKAVETAKAYIVSTYNKENIKITPYSVPDEVILPAGEIILQVDGNYNLPKLNKRLFIPIIVKINGKQTQIIRIGFEIQKIQRVVIAASDIKTKQIIIPKDLRVEKRDTGYLRQTPFTNIEEAIGKRATTFIRQGNILTNSLVECPPYIKKGDQVIITKRIGNLTIATPGISCEDGMIGERISVKNSDSKKMLNGVVCEGKKILID